MSVGLGRGIKGGAKPESLSVYLHRSSDSDEFHVPVKESVQHPSGSSPRSNQKHRDQHINPSVSVPGTESDVLLL